MKTEFAAKARNVAMEALKLSGMLCRHSFAFAKRISVACGKTAAECYRAAKPRVITEISQTAVRLRKLKRALSKYRQQYVKNKERATEMVEMNEKKRTIGAILLVQVLGLLGGLDMLNGILDSLKIPQPAAEGYIVLWFLSFILLAVAAWLVMSGSRIQSIAGKAAVVGFIVVAGLQLMSIFGVRNQHLDGFLGCLPFLAGYLGLLRIFWKIKKTMPKWGANVGMIGASIVSVCYILYALRDRYLVDYRNGVRCVMDYEIWKSVNDKISLGFIVAYVLLVLASLALLFGRKNLNGWFSLDGRARRKEFWGKCLVLFLIYWLISLPMAIFGSWSLIAAVFKTMVSSHVRDLTFPIEDFVLMEVGCCISNICFLVAIPAIVRRLHDRNMSGWWIVAFWLLFFVPYVGFISTIVAIIIIGFLDGTVGPNEFGVDPKEKERKRYFAPPQAIQAAPAVQTVEDRLEKIAYLKANGVLSDEEYEEARKKILSEL